jgi:hypothetical protein
MLLVLLLQGLLRPPSLLASCEVALTLLSASKTAAVTAFAISLLSCLSCATFATI